ncbi:unnamed protein product [Rotaria magnacalcarata]|uniref:Uncharacterized protein n=1 Tax=Rotaria magnacalcarata TaxID=392030 RepID=A0A814NPE3_9BILA|nr:unnamed protein product [Rotaria magnacalcarata]
MTSNRKSRKTADDEEDDDESIKDEQVRRDIQVLSERLYDLKARFMKIIHKMNNDSIEFLNEIPQTDDTPMKETKREIIDVEENSDSTKTSNPDSDDAGEEENLEEEEEKQEYNDDEDEDDEKQIDKSKIPIQARKLSIQSIIERQARRNKYFKHIFEYPKIMKYLMSDDPTCTSVPLRHLEPFIKQHIHKTPKGHIYDKVNEQIRLIRLNYLKTCI